MNNYSVLVTQAVWKTSYRDKPEDDSYIYCKHCSGKIGEWIVHYKEPEEWVTEYYPFWSVEEDTNLCITCYEDTQATLSERVLARMKTSELSGGPATKPHIARRKR